MKKIITGIYVLLVTHISYTTEITFDILNQHPHSFTTFLSQPDKITVDTNEFVQDILYKIADQFYDNNEYYASELYIKQANSYCLLDPSQTIQQHIENKEISLKEMNTLKVIKSPYDASFIKPAKK